LLIGLTRGKLNLLEGEAVHAVMLGVPLVECEREALQVEAQICDYSVVCFRLRCELAQHVELIPLSVVLSQTLSSLCFELI
jgi:hypothetical protein